MLGRLAELAVGPDAPPAELAGAARPLLARITGSYDQTQNVALYSWEYAVALNPDDVSPSPANDAQFQRDWALFKGVLGSTPAIPAWEISGNTRVPLDGSALVQLLPSSGGDYYSFHWPERYTPALITGGTGPAYAWEEAAPVQGGGYVAMSNGRSGTVSVNPAYDLTGAPTLPPGTPVWLERGYGACPDVVTAITVHGDGSSTPQEQTVYLVNATGGTWTLTLVDQFGNYGTTTALAYNANATAVQAAIRALTNFSDVTVSGLGTLASPFLITMVGTAYQDLLLGIGDPFQLIGVQEWLFQGRAVSSTFCSVVTQCIPTCFDPNTGKPLPNQQRWCQTVNLATCNGGAWTLAEDFPCVPCSCGSGTGTGGCQCCVPPSGGGSYQCQKGYCLTLSGVSGSGQGQNWSNVNSSFQLNEQFNTEQAPCQYFGYAINGFQYAYAYFNQINPFTELTDPTCWYLTFYLVTAGGVQLIGAVYSCCSNQGLATGEPVCGQKSYTLSLAQTVNGTGWPATLAMTAFFDSSGCGGGSGTGSGGTGTGSGGACCSTNTALSVTFGGSLASLGSLEIVWDGSEWSWVIPPGHAPLCGITEIITTCSYNPLSGLTTYQVSIFAGSTLIGSAAITSTGCSGSLGSASITVSGGSCNGASATVTLGVLA